MTAQLHEKLIYNGKELSMAADPFGVYIEKYNVTIPEPSVICSACWRGYVGEWEIKNDKLFLISINLYGDYEDSLNFFSPGEKEVFAEWFTGEIRVPCGEIFVEYIHHGYASLYERDLFLVIENGILVKQYEVDNLEKYQQSQEYDKKRRIQEVIEKKKARTDTYIIVTALTLILLIFIGICIAIIYLIKWGTLVAYLIIAVIVGGMIFFLKPKKHIIKKTTKDQIKIIRGEVCPYCNCATRIVRGDVIYPHRKNEVPRPKFLDKSYYICINNSDHYVGTYSDNVTSLGRLANKELRILKNKGHNVFDPLWKDKTHFRNQKEAYVWLSEKMNLPLEFTHFGMFTKEQCQEAIKYCDDLISSKSNH